MLPFHQNYRPQMFRLVAAVSMFGLSFAALVSLSSRTHAAQTATVVPPEEPRVLRTRELPPQGGGPAAARPNYVNTALTMRHWRQPEITFHLTPDPKDVRTPAEDRALVIKGLALWDAKLGSKLTLRMAKEGESPDVEVSFAAPGSLGPGKIGNTDVGFTIPQNDIQQATIQLVDGLPADQLVQAVAHECGHVLGIQGHSDETGDLMYPSVHTPAEITDRDQNTVNVAYYQIDTSKKVRDFKRGQKFGKAKSF